MPTSQPYGTRTQPTQRPSRLETDIAFQLRYLVRSVEPAIVFSSLAHLCVPIFSDECTVDIVEDDEVAYRIGYPRGDLDTGVSPSGHLRAQTGHDYAIRTRFADVGYTGVMTHRWRTRAPTPAEVSRALVLVRHGAATVRTERHEAPRRPVHDALGPHAADIGAPLDPAAPPRAGGPRLHHLARCETSSVARK